jgi:hypothetical protein
LRTPRIVSPSVEWLQEWAGCTRGDVVAYDDQVRHLFGGPFLYLPDDEKRLRQRGLSLLKPDQDLPSGRSAMWGLAEDGGRWCSQVELKRMCANEDNFVVFLDERLTQDGSGIGTPSPRNISARYVRATRLGVSIDAGRDLSQRPAERISRTAASIRA